MAFPSTQTVEIVVNGDTKEVPCGLSVLELLRFLGLQPDRVAVELNRSIVRRVEWEKATIAPGARLEIVQFVGGG